MQVDEAPILSPGSSESSRGERQLLARVRPFAPWSRRTSGEECWAVLGSRGNPGKAAKRPYGPRGFKKFVEKWNKI